MSPTLSNNCILLTFKNINPNSVLSSLIFGDIKKQDILVFVKPEWNALKKDEKVYVKRCIGLPGDTIHIQHTRTNRNVKPIPGQELSMYLYPQDTLFKDWTLTNYGPFFIPKKGSTIPLTDSTIRLYRKLIFFENSSAAIIGEKVLLNGQVQSTYTFKHNYYFMLGDNFLMSDDSRFWGCVPDISLLGKVIWHS